jgi:hypothetical protein
MGLSEESRYALRGPSRTPDPVEGPMPGRGQGWQEGVNRFAPATVPGVPYPPKMPNTSAEATAKARKKERATPIPLRGSILVTPTAMTE